MFQGLGASRLWELSALRLDFMLKENLEIKEAASIMIKNLLKYIAAALVPLAILIWPYVINIIFEIRE